MHPSAQVGWLHCITTQTEAVYYWVHDQNYQRKYGILLLFVAPRTKMIVNLNLLWSEFGRVHTTLFRTGRDRSRPVRAQLPVSTREQPERSFRFLETTSRHGTSGRDRSRSVAPCQLCRVDARPGASARSR